MAHKGIFTAAAVVLFEQTPTIDHLIGQLSGAFDVLPPRPAPAYPEMGGPCLPIVYRREVNGLVLADVWNRPWPDEMGGQQDHILFMEWGQGSFGPGAYPGNLTRALEQLHLCPEIAPAVRAHNSFVRIRSSYVLGSVAQDAPVAPADYDPVHELRFVTTIAQALLGTAGALAYFNPSGETLCDRATMEGISAGAEESVDVPELLLWTNRRLYNVSDAPGWLVMDTVGMTQLDLTDFELVFAGESYDPNDLARFLLNLASYTVAHGDVFHDGDTVDGPDKTPWRVHLREESLLPAPRRVFRLIPAGVRRPPL